MSFNELNAVEHFILNKLSGKNLKELAVKLPEARSA